MKSKGKRRWVMKKAFDLPKMKMSEAPAEKTEELLKKITEGGTFIAIGRTKEGENLVIYTDLYEDLFTTLIVAVNRCIPVFELFKAVIVSVEEYRKDLEKGHDLAIQAVEYIKCKNPFHHQKPK